MTVEATTTTRRARASTAGNNVRRSSSVVTRITVVNDYADFLALVSEVLGDEGHEVRTFSSDDARVEDIVSSCPDLLIVDVTVDESRQGAWGPTKVGSIRELDAVPVIVCSADLPALRGTAEKMLSRPRTYLLNKPFSLTELVETVNEALGAT